ncbi:ABC transporter ATP-binding protein [Bacillus weihaiensis]|uniref:ABC transporter ATP-binding protein n=1 Tax=Bacillus weihaiensis TaxID=1547283 RepID=UPI002352075D|nr:ABC transporter ATP-binding protein [Bacillus weihaiensis]
MIEVKGVEKKFKNFHLGPVSFTLEKGTAVALLGGNGSGKSTLFKLIMSIIQTETGSVHLFGQDMRENETIIKQKIGFLGDLYEPFSSLKVKQLVKLVSRWYPNWNHELYNHYLSRYQINENEKFGNCSKGTKKKVEFILSICHDPDILLLDEPTENLDIISKRKMKEDLIAYMADGEKSILLATHNMDDVRQICDFLILLDKGKLLHSFEKDELNESFARIWISNSDGFNEDHVNIVSIKKINSHSIELVTNNLQALDKDLLNKGISIQQSERLKLEEIVEYILDSRRLPM